MSWLRTALVSTFEKLTPRQQKAEAAEPPDSPEPPSSGPAREAAELYWTANGRQSRHERIEICSASANGMEVVLSQPLAPGLEVKIVLESGPPIPGWVRYCTENADGYRIELFILRPERRRSEHIPENQPATLEWFNPSSNEMGSDVIVRNSTPDGVQVELTREVPVPSVVRLCRGDWRQLGLTRYCNSIGEKYRVGIEFTHAPYHKDAADYEN